LASLGIILDDITPCYISIGSGGTESAAGKMAWDGISSEQLNTGSYIIIT
jgi:hypothetical protein